MLPYKDIFIDFDDTLYDTHGNATLALEELYDAFHLDRVFENKKFFTENYWEINENLWAQYAHGKITRDFLIVERFRRPLSMGKGANLSDDFCLELGEAFLEFNCEKTGVVDGARELLAHLKSRGYRLHICSNGFAEVQYRKLDKVGMTDYFDTIVLSEQAGANKPSSLFFDFSFAETKAVPESTMMIGTRYNFFQNRIKMFPLQFLHMSCINYRKYSKFFETTQNREKTLEGFSLFLCAHFIIMALLAQSYQLKQSLDSNCNSSSLSCAAVTKSSSAAAFFIADLNSSIRALLSSGVKDSAAT